MEAPTTKKMDPLVEALNARLADELAGPKAFREMSIDELNDWIIRWRTRVTDGRVDAAREILAMKRDAREAERQDRAESRATLVMIFAGIAAVAAVAGLIVQLL